MSGGHSKWEDVKQAARRRRATGASPDGQAGVGDFSLAMAAIASSGYSSEPLLLGGGASPIGWWVTFIEAPILKIERVLTGRWSNGRTLVRSDVREFPACLAELYPLEAPWTIALDCV